MALLRLINANFIVYDQFYYTPAPPPHREEKLTPVIAERAPRFSAKPRNLPETSRPVMAIFPFRLRPPYKKLRYNVCVRLYCLSGRCREKHFMLPYLYWPSIGV